MKNFLALSVLCVAVLLFAAGCKKELKEFSSTESGFTIKMPGEPKQESSQVDTEVGPIKMLTYSCEVSEGNYMVAVADYPEMVLQAGSDVVLDGAGKGAVEGMKGKMISMNPITIDGSPGREVVAEAKLENGTEASVKARIVLKGTRLYQALVLGKKGTITEAEMDECLTSLKITK